MAQDAVRRDLPELLRGLLVLGVLTLLCIASAEGVLRIAAPVPFESEVRHEVIQNLPGLKSGFVYEENRWGFRSLSMHSLEKPEGTVRILAIGASTTKQTTQSTEDTWTGVLDTMLNQALGGEARVEVLALGRSGKSARSRVLELRGIVERVKPDLLITLEGVNDLAWNGLPDYEYAGPESFVLDSATERRTALSRCREHLQLCRRLRLLRNRIALEVAKLRGRALEWHSEHLGEQRATYRGLPFVEHPTRAPDPFVEFRDAMAAILDRAAKDGLRAIVLGQPVIWHEGMTAEQQAVLWFWVGTPKGRVRPSPGWLSREIQRYNDAQRAEARAGGFRYVELNGRLPRDLDHFFDDCHLTDLGSRRQAELVFPAALAEVRAILAKR
jgi:lysophospholipase L1-like esterase